MVADGIVARNSSTTPKSWWETVPGVLTGVAALIGALTGAAVAYLNLPNNAKKPQQERYFVLESVDVPQGKEINALHILGLISAGNRTWYFPFPQQSLMWHVGSNIGKQIYPLPPSTEEASVLFHVEFAAQANDLATREETHVGAAKLIKAPGSGETTVYRIACKSCGTLSPALDQPVATLHFAISNEIPH